MPKIVDHEQRRAEIARALWRVVARDGMTAASARTVAAEAGWSLGAVRHYFPSQEALLRFAAEELMTTTPMRIVHILETRRRGVPRCVEVLAQLLPLDEQRSGEVRAFLALLVHAHSDPQLQHLPGQAWEGERRVCRLVVADLAGLTMSDLTAVLTQPPARTSPAVRVVDTRQPLPAPLEAEAAHLHVLLDGLTLQATLAPKLFPPKEVQGALLEYTRALAGRLRSPARSGRQ